MRKVDPERVQQQREDIVTAAIRACAKHGLQKCTTDLICREAGISPGRLYYYFRSKDAIVEAALMAATEMFVAEMSYTLLEGDLVAALKGIIFGYDGELDVLRRNPGIILDLLAYCQRSAELRAALHRNNIRTVEAMSEALERRKADGTLREDADIALLTATLEALISGIRVLMFTKTDYDLEYAGKTIESIVRPWLTEEAEIGDVPLRAVSK